MNDKPTDTGSPMEELRQAAKTLRERAEARDLPGQAFSATVTLIHPALAEPLADWLETEAHQYSLPPCSDPTGVCNRCEWSPGILDAIRVARAINGTAK